MTTSIPWADSRRPYEREHPSGPTYRCRICGYDTGNLEGEGVFHLVCDHPAHFNFQAGFKACYEEQLIRKVWTFTEQEKERTT